MKFTFLGTGAGKPTKDRNVCALALEFDQENRWYLFDCGEATQHQIQKSALKIGKLDTIFITHLHGDHIFGLPGLLASKKMDEALKPLTIYGPKGIKKFIECTIEVSRLNLGFDLEIIEFEKDQKFTFDKFTVTILALKHSIESFAFYIKENDICNKLDEKKLRAAGLDPSPYYGEIKRGKKVLYNGKTFHPDEFMLAPVRGKKVIIAGDNSEPEILSTHLDNLDLLIHEATYTQKAYDNLAKKVLHTTARKLAITAQKHHVKNLIATHISARYKSSDISNSNEILEELKSRYSSNVFVANDFDVFYLDRGGKIVNLQKNNE